MDRTQQEKKSIREPVKVVVYLENCRIAGTIYLELESRLSDFINSDLQFLPVTDAKVDSILPGHKWSYKVNFMNLNRNYIVSNFPEAEVTKG